VEYLLITAASRIPCCCCRCGRSRRLAAGEILREPRGWRAALRISALASAAHIAGDVITSYGTMVLAPRRTGAPHRHDVHIDLWFTGIIVAGLLPRHFFTLEMAVSRRDGAARAYVGFQFVQRQHALEFADQYAKTRGLSGARITAHRARCAVQLDGVRERRRSARFAHINLVRKEPRPYRPGDGFIARLQAPYLPLEQAIWVTRPRYGYPPTMSW